MSTSPDGVTAKAALRAELLRRRAERPGEDRAAAARSVAATLAARLAGIPTVAAFVPDPTEAGHGRLPGALAGTGARVLLPVVPARGRELDWAVHTGELTPGRFALLEPVGPRLGPGALAAAGAVVVPATAVARDGARLGRGGGYYDRALRHAPAGAVLVAVVFDDELVDRLPTEPHDVRVTAVVTPSGGWQALPAGH
ncbi:5-formyltetrahydrofolate cyclo-ligase [Blastococcus sp. KM273129]|uniref:5-formyltetrahydrofolate cyclo-ligase n=1 Tax=Blastococcus sp. KM273129 TaxID=2570315 RepID=UPI0027E0DD39|nr:5-formyltetrahydrofolate cyclo-ligase [Blastococcus sp. KM273129]MCF6734620.1 5-formyltetrahydrofolate cyclo-ligase [Blastococcus sp. KM273129]